MPTIVEEEVQSGGKIQNNGSATTVVEAKAKEK